MLDIAGITSLDVTVDGADEIDPDKNMIKGGGGALLREKILASISKEMIVVVDRRKLVEHLGAFPLPVEVIPFALDATQEQIKRLGFNARLRMKNDQEPVVTDGGNRIFDIDLKGVSWSPREIDQKLRLLPGVIEVGFFFGLAGRVVIGNDDGTVEIWNSSRGCANV
jgi:ribose 5-phosphate isomerase A